MKDGGDVTEAVPPEEVIARLHGVAALLDGGGFISRAFPPRPVLRVTPMRQTFNSVRLRDSRSRVYPRYRDDCDESNRPQAVY